MRELNEKAWLAAEAVGLRYMPDDKRAIAELRSMIRAYLDALPHPPAALSKVQP